MRKLIAILLLFSFIFGDAVHVNFLRIHSVAAHYQLHKSQDSKLGIMAFLKMHYQDKHGNSMVHKAHKTLPFKTGHQAGSANLLCYDIPDDPVAVTKIDYPVFVNGQRDITLSLNSGFPISQFHPPSFS